MKPLRLGVNIDHVATIRNARGGIHPDPVKAAKLAAQAGADGITAHLREDRRHISDQDIAALKQMLAIPLNLEMAATAEMQAIALATKPHAACIVPEKRQERTTEGGLDVAGNHAAIHEFVLPLTEAGIRVSLFIAPDPKQVEAAAKTSAAVIELHTGHYAETRGAEREKELARLRAAAKQAASLGLEVHAGHGLTFDNVVPIASIPEVVELNIGHFLIGQAVFTGLTEAVKTMRELMETARLSEGGVPLPEFLDSGWDWQ